MVNKNIFLLSWKKLGILLLLSLLSIILHNLLSALFGQEEAFFFILVIFVIPLYLLISLFITVFSQFSKKHKKGSV